MFSVRDSVEPEDNLGGNDIFPQSPLPPLPEATPITFDLPSTISGPTLPSSTSIATQNRKTPMNNKNNGHKRPCQMGVDGPIYSTEDVWEFPADSPAASSLSRSAKLRRREGMSDIAELEKTPTGRCSTRRHSISTIERRSTTKSTHRNSSVDDGSPIVPRKRRIRNDDDDTDRFSNSLARPKTAIGVLSPTSSRMSHPPTTEDLDIISRIEASPKRFVVEIPIRPSCKARAKTPLQEIVVENIPTSEVNATTSPADPIKCQSTTEDVNTKDAQIVAL